MGTHAIAALALLLGQNPAADVPIPEGAPLNAGRDLKVKPGVYVRPPLGDRGRGGVVVVRNAKKMTLDLAGVDLRGTPPGTDLDRNAGVGILVEDCEDVTIKGGRLGGYKACLVANRCKGLVLDGIAFDGWYGMRLLSTPAAEDESDWLYPHENDQDEWVETYGGAIALTECFGATIRNCRGRHGQNGILMTRSGASSVYDCDFSFLSGWGLALYRSSKNVVARNVFDYCVRGYSHGVYWRGQDSAGILMFERCSDNLFALNSATHGGDGVFLYAGHDLVQGRAADRGEKDVGGSDRNVWFQNDFSFAVANAIEATFSRDNLVIENDLSGSHQHGVWGGYSSRMVVWKNRIEGTLGGGVSIEHGQECAIAENRIRGNEIGIELWWDEDPDLVGGPFGKHHDTSSRDAWILENEFEENASDLALTKTKNVVLGKNKWSKTAAKLSGENFRLDVLLGPGGARASGTVRESTLDGFSGADPAPLAAAKAWKCPDLPGEQVAVREPQPGSENQGRKPGLDSIVLGEWGPWDFRSGEPRPAPRAAGGILAGCTWDATWFSWKDGPDPREELEGWRALAKSPLARSSIQVWTGPFGGDAEVAKKVGGDRFGLVASTRFQVKEGGAHRLSVTSDDGIRIRIDGKTVLEDWTWHAPKRGEAEVALAAGEHRCELEYFQIDGAMALAVDLEPK